MQQDVVAAAATAEPPNNAAMASSCGARRIGGVAPPSPYAPVGGARSNARRPGSGAPARPDSATTTSPIAPITTPASSEFVDRWLEKLYFRNPVVVRKQSAGVQRSSSLPPPAFSEALHNDGPDGGGGAVATAMLPPKPVAAPSSTSAARTNNSSSRAEQIRHEVVQERLVNAFSALSGGQGPSLCPYGSAQIQLAATIADAAGGGGGVIRPSGSSPPLSTIGKPGSRPPSPLAHGFSLPSRFVDKKKQMTQQNAAVA